MTLTREEIKNKIITILKENLDEWENADIDESSVLNTDVSVDSIRFIYLMTKVEAAFGISVPERKWAKLVTFGDVIDAVQEEIEKK